VARPPKRIVTISLVVVFELLAACAACALWLSLFLENLVEAASEAISSFRLLMSQTFRMITS